MAAKKKSPGSTKRRTKAELEKVKKSAGKIWLAGLGAFSLAEEEGGKLFRNLVAKGKSFESKGKEQLAKAKKQFDALSEAAREKASDIAGDVRGRTGTTLGKLGKLGDNVDDAISSALHKVGVPTREEIQRLTRRIEQLTVLVEGKESGRTRSTRKTAKRPAKKAARKAAPRKRSTRKAPAK